MGTYLGWYQPDENKRKATETFMRSFGRFGIHPLWMWNEEDVAIEKAKGPRGSPDYKKLGEGQIKLSGKNHTDAFMRRLCEHLKRAVDEFGLVLDIPTDIDDYMPENAYTLLVSKASLTARKAAQTREYRASRAARDKAVAAHQKKIGSLGQPMFRGWGPEGDVFHGMYGNVERCTWLLTEWEFKGEKQSEVFRTQEGHGVMLFPLMPMGKGTMEKFFEERISPAYSIGMRTPANIVMQIIYDCGGPSHIKLSLYGNRTYDVLRHGEAKGVIQAGHVTVQKGKPYHSAEYASIYTYVLVSRTKVMLHEDGRVREGTERLKVKDKNTLAQLMCLSEYGCLPWETIPKKTVERKLQPSHADSP